MDIILVPFLFVYEWSPYLIPTQSPDTPNLA